VSTLSNASGLMGEANENTVVEAAAVEQPQVIENV
jgi:hypothetical protein